MAICTEEKKGLRDCEGSDVQAGAPTTSHHARAWAYGSSLPREGGETVSNVMKRVGMKPLVKVRPY